MLHCFIFSRPPVIAHGADALKRVTGGISCNGFYIKMCLFFKAPNGINRFKHQRWQEFCGEGSLKEKHLRVVAAWTALATHEKAAYADCAKNDFDDWKARSESVDALGANPGKNHGKNRTSEANLRKAAVSNTLEKMVHHPIWRSGFRISDFNSGVKPAMISSATDAAIDKLSKDMFYFDPKIVENPKRAMKPFQCCGLKYGGMCPNGDIFAKRGAIACKNLYCVLKQHDLKATQHQPESMSLISATRETET